MSARSAKLLALLEPSVTELGFEIVDLEYHPAGKHSRLRVYIDAPAGITLADCEQVSREVSAVLDVEDPIAGHFELEVSSPGLDRVLRKPEHFERFVGAAVKVRLTRPSAGHRKFSGNLVRVTDDGIVVEADDERVRIAFEEIEQARLVPEL